MENEPTSEQLIETARIVDAEEKQFRMDRESGRLKSSRFLGNFPSYLTGASSYDQILRESVGNKRFMDFIQETRGLTEYSGKYSLKKLQRTGLEFLEDRIRAMKANNVTAEHFNQMRKHINSLSLEDFPSVMALEDRIEELYIEMERDARPVYIWLRALGYTDWDLTP